MIQLNDACQSVGQNALFDGSKHDANVFGVGGARRVHKHFGFHFAHAKKLLLNEFERRIVFVWPFVVFEAFFQRKFANFFPKQISFVQKQNSCTAV